MKRRLFLASTALAALTVSLSITMPAQAADPILSKSWDDIVTQAKQEGQVVWYNWFFQPKLREIAAAFTEEYGIQVTIPDGTDAGNFDKFIADSSRPEGDIDVMSMDGDATNKFDATGKLIGPLNILPEFADLRTQINGGDSKGYAVAYWGNQTGLAYDPDKVKEADLPQTWQDLEAYIKAHPLQFAFNDLRNGGAGSAFVQAAVRNTETPADITKLSFGKAWEWLNANKGKYGFTASNNDSLTRLSGGEFSIVSAWEDNLGGLQKSGEVDKRIKFYIPKFGMPGGGNIVGVPTNAKHKAAALLFISWLTSAKTQVLLNEKMSIAPVNAKAVGQGHSSVTPEMRAYSVDWLPIPIATPLKAEYLEKVVLQ